MELSNIQQSVLIGLLLGDGCLFLGKSNRNPLLSVARAEKDLEYLKWQYEIFKDLCSDKGIIISNKLDRKTGKTYKVFKFRTRALPVLKPFYDLWYPNKKKVIPSNLELDKISIAVWLCDDGCIRLKNGRNGKIGPALQLKLSTNSFSKSEVTILKNKLYDRYNFEFKICHDSLNWYKKRNPNYIINNDYNFFLKTFTKGTDIIFNDIKDNFPPGMERKFNVWKESYIERLVTTSS
jgi:hypothetical protein